MPECERCGDAHATVNEATWVNQSIMLCPACWDDVTSEPHRLAFAEPRQQPGPSSRDDNGGPDLEIEMVSINRGFRSVAKVKRWLIEKSGGVDE